MTQSTPPLEQFRDAAPDYLPGLLVLFNLADTKRRNCHIGHKIVDKDIEEFDRLLRSSMGDSGFAKRISGDSWLAIYPKDSAQSLNLLLDTYQLQQEIQVGWRSTATREGSTKVVERTVPATITRGVRCLYSTTESLQEMTGLIEELLEQYHSIAPNIAVQMSECANHEGATWRCISSYPSENPFCPFCDKTDIDWKDGDGSVYAGSGTCKHCGAYVDIRGVEELRT